MYLNSSTYHGRILKIAAQERKFPKRERFQEDLDQSIKESRQSKQQCSLNSYLDQKSLKDAGSLRSSSRNDVILSTKSSKVSRMTRSVISKLTAKSVLERKYLEKKDSLEELSYHSKEFVTE